MSDTYYTCDYCVESGNDEYSLHRDYYLAVYNGKVVCDGCRECGEFPEFNDDDAVLIEFIPPDKQRIALLEAHITTDNSAVIATLEARIALLEAAIRTHRDSGWFRGRDEELYAVLQEDKPHE